MSIVERLQYFYEKMPYIGFYLCVWVIVIVAQLLGRGWESSLWLYH